MNRSNRIRWALGCALMSAMLAGCGGLQKTPSATTAPPAPDAAETSLAVANDVVFATSRNAEASEWKLDIYAPSEPGQWPVVLFTHGFGGNRRGYVELSEAIAERGAVVFTFDWPALVEDIAVQENGRGLREMTETVLCAIRYASGRAAEYGGDPQRIVLGGHSYAGFVIAWAGMSGEDADGLWADHLAAYGGPPRQVACVEDEGSIGLDGVIGVAGSYGLWDIPRIRESHPDLIAIADPFARIGDSPGLHVRLIHGEQDDIVPLEAAVTFHEALVSAGYDSELAVWDGGHGVPIDLTVDTIMGVLGY